MKLKIEEIEIGTRIRQEPDDLNSLKKSIKEVGLINPIIVNFEKKLVSGLRRLEACRQLGLTEIEVKIMDKSSDSVKQLDIEYHENLGRISFTEAEKQDYDKSRDELLNPSGYKKRFWGWLQRFWEKIKSFFRSKRKADISR